LPFAVVEPPVINFLIDKLYAEGYLPPLAKQVTKTIVFYKPPSASKSWPSRLLGLVTTSNAPRGLTASLYDRQTTSELNQQNGISKDQMLKSRNVNNLSPKGYSSDQRCKNETVQEQGMCRHSPSESPASNIVEKT
jgi:hypothetical protein